MTLHDLDLANAKPQGGQVRAAPYAQRPLPLSPRRTLPTSPLAPHPPPLTPRPYRAQILKPAEKRRLTGPGQLPGPASPVAPSPQAAAQSKKPRTA